MAIGDFLGGVWDQAKGTVTGTWEAITHPIETAQAIGYAVSHPVDTFNAVTSSVGDAFSKNPAEATGRAAFEVALLFTPAGLTKIANAAKAARAAKAAGTVAEVADKAGDLSKVADLAGDAGKVVKGVSLSEDILNGIRRLPKGVTDEFGHGVKKHGPKSADQIAALKQSQIDAVAGGKKFKDVTWFGDDAKLAKAIESAPDQLAEILKSDPKKLQEFQAFLNTPKEGGAFGFRYKVPGETSLGSGLASDGAALANDGTAYIRYSWAKVKGGGLEPQVFTAFPVGTR